MAAEFEIGVDCKNCVVVGVDGSEHSRLALAWGARQARLTATPLVLITTWEYPASFGAPIIWPENIDFAADAWSILRSTLAEVLGPDPDIEVRTTVVHGPAALVLTAASTSAALVVVGSRGHGELSGLLLGSVSEYVATHARCPVSIVRGKEQRRAAA